MGEAIGCLPDVLDDGTIRKQRMMLEKSYLLPAMVFSLIRFLRPGYANVLELGMNWKDAGSTHMRPTLRKGPYLATVPITVPKRTLWSLRKAP